MKLLKISNLKRSLARRILAVYNIQHPLMNPTYARNPKT